MNSITQDMKYRQSLLTYAQKYGVSRASRKYNKSRSYFVNSLALFMIRILLFFYTQKWPF